MTYADLVERILAGNVEKVYDADLEVALANANTLARRAKLPATKEKHEHTIRLITKIQAERKAREAAQAAKEAAWLDRPITGTQLLAVVSVLFGWDDLKVRDTRRVLLRGMPKP